MTTGFFGLFRLGELTWSDNKSLQDWTKIILRTGISIDRELQSATIQLPYMKNDRYYEGSRTIIASRKDLGPLDPVIILQRYLLVRDQTHGGHTSLFVVAKGSIPLRSWFIRNLRDKLGKEYAGHSLRSGGATWMAMEGKTEEEIKRAGRWRSDAFLSYIRKNVELARALELRLR